jgi:hypothetical protein
MFFTPFGWEHFMADSRTAEALRRKREEIARSTDDYTARLEQAAPTWRIDAAIAIPTCDEGKPVRRYVGRASAVQARRAGGDQPGGVKGGPRNTRELTLCVMAG